MKCTILDMFGSEDIFKHRSPTINLWRNKQKVYSWRWKGNSLAEPLQSKTQICIKWYFYHFDSCNLINNNRTDVFPLSISTTNSLISMAKAWMYYSVDFLNQNEQTILKCAKNLSKTKKRNNWNIKRYQIQKNLSTLQNVGNFL